MSWFREIYMEWAVGTAIRALLVLTCPVCVQTPVRSCQAASSPAGAQVRLPRYQLDLALQTPLMSMISQEIYPYMVLVVAPVNLVTVISAISAIWLPSFQKLTWEATQIS